MGLSIIRISSPGKISQVHKKRINKFQKAHFGFVFQTDIEDHWWWAVFDHHQMVAIAAASYDYHRTDIYFGPCGVLPEYRGRGLQRRLILVRIGLARKEGFARAISMTDTDNYPSANNFIRTGFTLGPPWKASLHKLSGQLFWRRIL